LDINRQKEQLSVAYVHAVASAAGCSVKDVKVDDDSVDLSVVSRMEGKKLHAPELNIQLKATSQDFMDESELTYPLKLKNYDDLRKKTLVPRILVVMVLPDEPAKWLKQAEFKTHLYRCCYWVSLLGQQATTNTTSVSVKIPRKNILTPDAISSMMSVIADGGDL
jgi:hypothetical protein